MNTIVFAIWLVTFTAGYGFYFLYMMHMYQLNSYKYKEHMEWVTGTPGKWLKRSILGIVSLILAATGTMLAILVASVLNIIGLLINLPKKAKKPLAYTPRVKRMLVTASISLLIILGFSISFHHRLGAVIAYIWYLLTPMAITLVNFINKPIEGSVNQYYINDARKILESMPHLKVVGITGSYGKTSVKYFLSKLLATQFNVLHTPGNYNTTLGVVRTVRAELKAFHDIFVCEMGARQVNDIKEICDLVHPQYGIITSIGNQHLQSFLTIENIIKTKFELADAIPTDGLVFLNYDNECIRNHKIDKMTIGYGIDHERLNKYHAYDISVSHQGTGFKVKAPDNEEYVFQTRLVGKHNVENITGAIAVANQLGISMEKLIYPVKQLESVPHRLQLINRGSSIILDDSYNSNPSGFKGALDVLSGFDDLRILLTPGMVELGSKQYESNKEVGIYAVDKCDYAVLVGAEQTKPIYDGLEEAGFAKENIIIVANIQEGFAYINGFEAGGKKKVILIENDLPDNY